MQPIGRPSSAENGSHTASSSLQNSRSSSQGFIFDAKQRLSQSSCDLRPHHSNNGMYLSRPSSDGSPPAEAESGGMESGRNLPGSWYFEEYKAGQDDNSHMHDDEYGLRAALSCKNITVCVTVPTSEHVAEIVGRQGCKIKALRTKTNTYIKTPVRGEEPVFMVTGRADDVAEARRQIDLAADHFTTMRSTRKSSVSSVAVPHGHVTAYVRVPLRVVGLVVGPKGATIKRIQQDTHTYIITPSREREPIFEVTGLPHNVETARKEIEQHIFQRTGNMPITDPTASITTAELQSSLNAAAARTKAQSIGILGSGRARHPTPEATLAPMNNGPSLHLGGIFNPFGVPQEPLMMNIPPPSFNVPPPSWNNPIGILTPSHTDNVMGRGLEDWSQWQSALSIGGKSSRDEGLGDSPPVTFSTTTPGVFSIAPSIWTAQNFPNSHQ